MLNIKKFLNNTLFASIIFYILYFIIAFLIPNNIPGSVTLELILPAIIFTYAYISVMKKRLSTKQKLVISTVFIIITTLLISTTNYYRIIAESGTADIVGLVTTQFIVAVVYAVLLYLIFTILGNWLYRTNERLGH